MADPRRDAIARERRRARRRESVVVGTIYLTVALATLVFAVFTVVAGKLTLINGLVFALAIAGTTPVGILALQGDFLGTRSMDEGQRQMSHAAQSDAFHVAYLGLYALFCGAILFPALRDAIPIAIGVLLLLTTIIWIGGYMWRRWLP